MVDVQPLVDKAGSKLVPWHGKNIVAIGGCTLVKSVITSQAIFYITPRCFASYQQARVIFLLGGNGYSVQRPMQGKLEGCV
jgi:hypothetical protein